MLQSFSFRRWLQFGNGQTQDSSTPPARPSARAAMAVEPLENRRMLSGDVVLKWNELLMQSLGNQPPRVPLARNMSIVHVAMFDAVNAIERSYEPYFAEVHASQGASPEAAAAQAARDTLVALYPARQAVFDAALAEDLAEIPPGLARQGVEIGQEVAQQILDLRANDGAAAIVTYTPPNNNPGQWQPTAPNFAAPTNTHVSQITPFGVQSSTQFRPGAHPALDSPEYAAALNEVKSLGGATGSTRTPDQTLVAELWRQPANNHIVWNRIAQGMAEARNTNLVDSARLFALLDMSINDGLQTSNGSKYHYALWRPITAIRRASEDGNAATEENPAWLTLHATTPPYPSYAGNASTIGAASATVLAGVFGSDEIAFDVDWSRYVASAPTRSYPSFSAAADEMADSRVYGGIHFSFDNDAGKQVGANVAGYIMEHLLSPATKNDDPARDASRMELTAIASQDRALEPLHSSEDFQELLAGLEPAA